MVIMSRCLLVVVLVAPVVASPAPAPLVSAPKVAPTTCGAVKQLYRDNKCCGHPAQAITVGPACGYNFNKPTCAMAEPQAPRDLSTGAAGLLEPKASTLTVVDAARLPQVNVHYILGAEHKSDSYKDGSDTVAYDAAHGGRRLVVANTRLDVMSQILDLAKTKARQFFGYDAPHGGRRLAANPRPGYMCAAAPAAQLKPYTFEHCKGTDVKVGKSYEVHHVYSSAGYDADHLKDVSIDMMDDGLGGASNGRGMLNPMIMIQAQVFQIVNDDTGVSSPANPLIADMVHGWQPAANNDNRVMYPGSTTGSHTNSICSPYAVTWHVDTACHKVSAASFDKMCQMMKATYNLDSDLSPHGARLIVDPKWVAKPEFVEKLA